MEIGIGFKICVHSKRARVHTYAYKSIKNILHTYTSIGKQAIYEFPNRQQKMFQFTTFIPFLFVSFFPKNKFQPVVGMILYWHVYVCMYVCECMYVFLWFGNVNVCMFFCGLAMCRIYVCMYVNVCMYMYVYNF